jgi:hypothetical protein
MHENVPQPGVVDRVACRGAGCHGHGHRARGRDRPSPCPGAARRHHVRPAAHAHADCASITGAQPGGDADARTVTNARIDTYSAAVTNARIDTDSGTITDTQGLAHPVPDADTISDAGTVAVGNTNTRQPPIVSRQ